MRISSSEVKRGTDCICRARDPWERCATAASIDEVCSLVDVDMLKTSGTCYSSPSNKQPPRYSVWIECAAFRH